MKEPRPPQLKSYEGTPVPLPRQLPVSGTPTLAALSGAPASLEGPLDLPLLSRVLFHSAGVVRYLPGTDGTIHWFRAAGSSGNLSPLEVYVVTGQIGSLDPGVYHYEPVPHGLSLVRAGDTRAALAAATASAPVQASIVITGVPWRAGWKYGERGLRNIYRDAGTMLSQLLAVAGTATATAASLRLAFMDLAVTKLLDVDGIHEFPVAVVDLGPPGQVTRDPVIGARSRGSLGPQSIEFPLVTEAQHAGDLADAAAVRDWRDAAGLLRLFAVAEPRGTTTGESIEESIRHRGSTRRYRRAAAPPALLDGLSVALRPPTSDAIADGWTLLEHAVAVHDIEGSEPGIYRYRDGKIELERGGEVRALATALCVDQPLAGEGACAVFHSAPLEEILDACGDRGYRSLLVESGFAGGRLHLVARALGLGASGLNFYDDAVRERLELRSHPQLVTTIGVPGYRPKPGGDPGEPARLRAIPSTK